MKLFFFQAVVSAVYVVDAGAAPIMHIPLLFLTALYFASIAELWGLSKVVSWVRRGIR